MNLSTTEKTFEIGKTDGLDVELAMGKKVSQSFCTDIAYPDEQVSKTLIGKTGQAFITLSKEAVTYQPYSNAQYTVAVTLSNVHFLDENGNNSGPVIDTITFKDIKVGWFPG